MYPFDYQYRTVIYAQATIGKYTLSCSEIKFGELHLFALEQGIELIIEER